MMNRASLLVLFLAAWTPVHAEPWPWMMKSDPNVLARMVDMGDDCLVNTSEAVEIVDSILIRARIKPINFSSKESFGFVTTADCLSPEDGRAVYTVQTYFWRIVFGRPLLEMLASYQQLGVGDSQAMRTSIRDTVEDLVTDYLQANFDLKP